MSAGSMTGSVTRTLDLPVGAEEVWGLLGDFNGLPRWNAGLEHSELSNGGKRRTLSLKAGGKVVEDLVHHDDAARTLSYTIVEGPIPVTRHKATLSVIDRAPGGSTVRWTCEFEPKGAPVDTVAGIFSAIFEDGLKQLAGLYGGSQNPR